MISEDFKRGAEAAADVASHYDIASTHPLRLGDCILGKLNLRDGKPRRNKHRIQDPEAAWLAGVALALAEVHRLLLGGNDSRGVCKIAAEAGLTLAAGEAAGVDPFDLKELHKAGVPSGKAPKRKARR